MENSRTTQRYRYIIRMIEKSQFDAHGLPQKFFDEDVENSYSLFFQIKKACADEFRRTSELDSKLAFRILTTALSKYLLRYPATTAVRQRLYQHIFAWCESLGDQFHIPDYEMFLSDIPHPMDRDLAITLVKELHSQDGISKADLAKKHYANNCMDALASQQVVHEFGFDRTLYVLANTIQFKDWDGRFSQDNKAWARTVQVAGGDEGIRDHRWKFVVDKSHPGLTDMFTSMVRHDQVLAKEQRASVREMLKAQPRKNSPNNSANLSKGQER